MKTTKKTLSLILVMAMVLTLFAGVAQASTSFTISSPGERILAEDGRIPGVIVISEAADMALTAGQRTDVRITLPDGMEWTRSATTTDVVLVHGATTTTAELFPGSSTRDDFDRVLAFTVSSTVALLGREANVIRLLGPAIDVPSGFRGALNADVQVTRQDGAGGFISRQTTTVTIATVFAEGTTSRVRDATNILRGAGDQLVGRIEIREDLATVFPTGTIRLTLPDGITFATATVSGNAGAIGFLNNRQRMTIPVAPTPTTDTRQTINITNIRLNVAMAVGDGPVNIVIDNHPDHDANVTRATLTVATVGVGAVTVERQGDLPGAWNLGRLDRDIADIRLAEVMAGALTPDRTVALTLPAGYTWHTAFTAHDGAFVGEPTVSDGGRTLTYWTRVDATNSRTDFDLEGATINARIDATPGDVVVTVGGNAGASGTAVVATSRRPVTVTVVSTPNVRANELNQLIGNIVITENFAGALREGNLEIVVPGLTLTASSVSVSDVVGSEPTARVISPGVIAITPAIAPTNPATITISGIRGNFGVGTLINVGAITADVVGNSVLHAPDADLYDFPVPEPQNTIGIAHPITIIEAIGSLIVNDIVVANLVARQAAITVFTVGSTAFTVDGVAQPALDVAPVIQDGRTMMPIRAAANAAGVTNENIFFDAGVITIIRGDRVVQLTLGSRVMVVNGVAMNMDAAPALVAGRALIPVRWVGTALGVPVNWDPAVRTVTVTVE